MQILIGANVDSYYDWAFIAAFGYTLHVLMWAINRYIHHIPAYVQTRMAMGHYEADLLRELEDAREFSISAAEDAKS